MTLGLMDRLSTLMKADAHGVVESLEDRTLLLKQYLREAELAFDQTRAREAALREDSQRLGEEIARDEAALAALDEDVQLALAGGKDELARFAIRRLIPQRRALAALRTRHAECTAEAAALAERVTEQQARLDALRTRVRAELARGPAADTGRSFALDPEVADEEVELELLRRREGGSR